MNYNKDAYLMTLIRELEKEGNKTKLDNFIIVVEELLQIKYRLRNYFNYPISEPQYDELIERAEDLLGVEHKEIQPQTLIGGGFATADLRAAGIDINTIYSGRTNGATSADGASIDSERVAIDDYPYTKEELEGTSLNGLYKEQQVTFTAKQDIKKGDFVLIDEYDNQSVIPAAEMEVSGTTSEDLFKELDLKKGQPDYKVETVDVNELVFEDVMKEDITKLSDKVMDEYKDAYAALGSKDSGYNSGALYSMKDVKMFLDKAPEELKMIWYYSPFGQFFVGDITGKRDFPFIYKNEDPAHNDYIKNTAVIGPFKTIDELEWYFDLLVHENAGMDDEFIKDLTELVAAIKFYESRNDTAKYDTIIDSLWSELKTFLMGNI